MCIYHIPRLTIYSALNIPDKLIWSLYKTKKELINVKGLYLILYSIEL